MNFDFKLKKSLTDEEFEECFAFMETYLVSIYGEDSISDENFQIWKRNRGEKENRFFIKMQNKEEVCGYAEILIEDEKTMHFCDIIIKEKMRRTKIVHEFIRYLLGVENFKNIEEITLYINRKNKTSYNTWKILGMVKDSEFKYSNRYKILRTDVENYFNKSIVV